MDRKKVTVLLVLHVILAIYSVGGIFSKMAAKTNFLSLEFCLYYFGLILILGIYAIAWQQIIKELPLTVAFANKAVTVIWGIVWGIMFFNEAVTPLQLVGVLMIIIGIIIYSIDIGEKKECQS